MLKNTIIFEVIVGHRANTLTIKVSRSICVLGSDLGYIQSNLSTTTTLGTQKRGGRYSEAQTNLITHF
jgi:hypothetical protein